MTKIDYIKYLVKIQNIEKEINILDSRNSLENKRIQRLKFLLNQLKQEIIQNKKNALKPKLTLVSSLIN